MKQLIMHYRPVRGSDINMKCQKLVAAIVLSGIVAINQAYASTSDTEKPAGKVLLTCNDCRLN